VHCKFRLSSIATAGDEPEKPTFNSRTNDPSHQAPPFRHFAARSRSCVTDLLFAATFRYRLEPSRPGRASGSFPLARSTALMGFIPFAGLLPPAGGDAFLRRRAHVPVRPFVTPRLIFVELIGRSAMGLVQEKSGEDHARLGWLLGFAPVVGPCRKAPARTVLADEPWRSFLPWASPLSGLWTTPTKGQACTGTGSTPL
jgi:hypothetical protein